MPRSNSVSKRCIDTPKRNQASFLTSDYRQTVKKTRTKKIEIQFQLPQRIFRYGCFKSLQVNRPRIIDWLFQIGYVHELYWSTILTTLEIMDSLIEDHAYTNIDNLHLSVVVCLFISSKFVEHNPFKLLRILNTNIASMFKKEEILAEQHRILELIWSNPKSNFNVSKNILDYLVEIFPKVVLDQSKCKEVLRQIVMVWILPSLAMEQPKSYRQVIMEVVSAVQRGTVKKGVAEIEQLFLEKYNLIWVRKASQHLKL